MEELIRFYEDRIGTWTEVAERLKKTIHRFGTFRLILFAAAVAVIWVCRNSDRMSWLGMGIAFAIPFVVSMILHTRFVARRQYAEEMTRLNRNELQGLAGDFGAFDGAAEESDAQHAYSVDLDLFGPQSLFQSINRTVTQRGKKRLTEWFKQPLTDKTAILRRQQAVQELTSKTSFRQHFYVTGISRQSDLGEINPLEIGIHRRTPFSQSRLWRILTGLIPCLWIAVAAAVHFVAGFPAEMLGCMLGISFLTANIQGRKIQSLHRSADQAERLLLTCSQLIELIEKEPFRSAELQEAQQLLVSPAGTASRAIKQLSRLIGSLDQRYSLIGILLNLLYLRDMRQVMRLEKWMASHAAHFDTWFESLTRIDALCSLGGFAYNHPDYVYPEIAETYFRMEGKALGHPLLNRTQCVRNDLHITKHPYFLVVTGANMAGKSTYLRTVGVNFVLACMGLPVCAESLTVYPAHLVTSLRTIDSLTEHESYFFAELKRLKMIIDRLNAGEALFIILDEVLKGTNSEDKQKGSLALIRQLISKKACGLIATHDLLLGKLKEDFPDQIRNYCFEADIRGDELTFTYRMREGIARNMNACFLMKKMGITL